MKQNTVLRVLPYQHPPLCQLWSLPVTPSLCLFLDQTNFIQVSLIIFSFHARNKPCYPPCLEHPPTFQTILFFISALISVSLLQVGAMTSRLNPSLRWWFEKRKCFILNRQKRPEVVQLTVTCALDQVSDTDT